MAEPADDTPPSLRDLAEQVLEETMRRLRGNGGGVSDRASRTMTTVLNEFGLVQRRDHEDLELRVAQLEHRLKLLEASADTRAQEGRGRST
ncbi:MAG: hypothetical protein ACE5EV_07390 [Gaiellales bacterium]